MIIFDKFEWSAAGKNLLYRQNEMEKKRKKAAFVVDINV